MMRSLKFAQTNKKNRAEKLIQKCSRHLWYLGEELVALAFFDTNISIDDKIKKAQCLKAKDST